VIEIGLPGELSLLGKNFIFYSILLVSKKKCATLDRRTELRDLMGTAPSPSSSSPPASPLIPILSPNVGEEWRTASSSTLPLPLGAPVVNDRLGRARAQFRRALVSLKGESSARLMFGLCPYLSPLSPPGLSIPSQSSTSTAIECSLAQELCR